MKSWTEVVIDDNCDFAMFYRTVEVLQENFIVTFCNIISDFDTLYWDFLSDGVSMTLHYNVFFGITLYPTKMSKANDGENLSVLQLGLRLKGLIISKP
jgi:hypothetical protein